MDYLQRLARKTKLIIFIVILIDNAILLGAVWLARRQFLLSLTIVIVIAAVITLIGAILIATSLGDYLLQPITSLWRVVLRITPDNASSAMQPENISLGQELVTDLITHIYSLANAVEKAKTETTKEISDLNRNFIAQNLPLPFLVLDKSENIKFANQATANYIGMPVVDLLGKNIYMILDMAFPSENTFDNWLKQAKASSATATSSWARVRVNVRDNHPLLLFDLAAYYNRDNPDGNQTMLVLFDHTKEYSQDDQAISYVALTVHELRAPLTLMRGYTEVITEELDGKADPELQSFLDKMKAQEDQLMAFVNNILNVARVDSDQLELKLEAADWLPIIKSAVESISLRAKVRGITLHCAFAKGLPKVGVDPLSIYEVLNNLVDNAIKYSGKSKVINVATYLSKDGYVETTVQDFGLGIPESVMPNLFTKYFRDFRNRAQIGGTGLGLYLSKSIVKAHGGNLWVRSQEGKGSTFGFTLVPYDKLSQEMKDSGERGITRNARGWVKNHSLYRR